MKLKYIIPITIIVLLLLILATVFLWSITVDESIEGVLFRNNIGQTEEIHVLEIEGRYYRNIFKGNELLGTFNIVGLNLPDGIDRARMHN